MAEDLIRKLMIAMALEAERLDLYIEKQRIFARAMRNRDWQALQMARAVVEGISESIAAAEADRAMAEADLRAELHCADEGLYRLALHVREPLRTDLTDYYRKLKISAMRARLETEMTEDYAAGKRELLGSVLEELFPEKKGRIYGRSGKALQPESGALVLNTAF